MDENDQGIEVTHVVSADSQNDKEEASVKKKIYKTYSKSIAF